MRKLCAFALAVSLLPFGWSAAAQAGVILAGTVVDPTGAVIPEATVTLTNKDTGVSRETTANGDGYFSFRNVSPGEYVVTAESEGFVEAETVLTIGAQAPAPIALMLDINVSGEVTVTDTKIEKLLEPDKNANRVDFDDDLLRDLPTDTRNILPVLNNFLSQAAQGTEGISIVVDGVEDNQLSLPAGAIRRIVINMNPYSAEYRRPGKARVEVLTKDGSRRKYEGEIAFYGRHSALDARNTFALEKERLSRRLVEFNFGGPITSWKSLTFFASGEYMTNEENVVVNAFTLNGPLIQNVPTYQREISLSGRVDMRPSIYQRLSMRYEFESDKDRNRGVGGFRLAEQANDASETNHKVQFSARSILSDSFLNEFRFVFERESAQVGARTEEPTIRVRGAFVGGPSGLFQTERETSLEFKNISTYTRGRHIFRFGGGYKPRRVTALDESNFNGTFEFLSLSAFADQSPYQYRINQGDPNISFSKHEAFGFIQDEIKLRRNLQLTLGLRYDWQSNISDKNNFAPRIAFAYAPFSRTVIRGGAGIFYERLAETATQRALLLDGARNREIIVFAPSFTDPLGGNLRAQIKPSIFRIAPDIVSPYITQAGISVEQRLWGRTQVTFEYFHLKGTHLFRGRNVNAQIPPRLIFRPNPNFLNIDQVESSASMKSDALSVTLQARARRLFKVLMQYTFSQTRDNTDGLFFLPANNYDLRPEWGRSNFDRKHRLNLVGSLEMPFYTKMSAIFSYASGLPYNITTGFDDNGDLTANDRPPLTTRNTGLGPDFMQLDLRFTKKFRLWRPIRQREDKSDRKLQNVEMRFDVFNVLNRPNYVNYVGERSSAFFGRANAALQARTMQFSVSYEF